MTSKTVLTARKIAAFTPLFVTLGMLGACGGDDPMMPPPVVVTPMPTPSPTPSPTTFNVSACLQQVIPGTGGVTVAGAVVPDTLTLNLAAASGFPNGRKLSDPVIDVTLAVIFLDLSKNGAGTLAGIPLNPAANDLAFPASFPFLAGPQGTPVLAPSNGSGFTFRSNAPNGYTRVDRMGMPAVATALIGSDMKDAYNDANPVEDAAGSFVPELTKQLTGLTNALADDLVGAGLSPCAQPN